MPAANGTTGTTHKPTSIFDSPWARWAADMVLAVIVAFGAYVMRNVEKQLEFNAVNIAKNTAAIQAHTADASIHAALLMRVQDHVERTREYREEQKVAMREMLHEVRELRKALESRNAGARQ